MWEKGLGHAVGALLVVPYEGGWDEANVLLGTVFPISEEEALFIGAKHTFPGPTVRTGILIWRNDRMVRTLVEEVRDLPGHPDIVVIRAGDGAPSNCGVAAGQVGIWTDVTTVGYPEDAIHRQNPEETLLTVRGLKGHVSRHLDPGQAPGVQGAALELSFPIPSGMSGAPLVSTGGSYLTGGLMAVCIGSLTQTTTPLEDELREDGTLVVRHRMVEYGIACPLNPSVLVPFVEKPLIKVVGFGEGGAVPA